MFLSPLVLRLSRRAALFVSQWAQATPMLARLACLLETLPVLLAVACRFRLAVVLRLVAVCLSLLAPAGRARVVLSHLAVVAARPHPAALCLLPRLTAALAQAL